MTISIILITYLVTFLKALNCQSRSFYSLGNFIAEERKRNFSHFSSYYSFLSRSFTMYYLTFSKAQWKLVEKSSWGNPKTFKALTINVFNSYTNKAIISRVLYIFYFIFHCGLYCRVVSVTNNLCTKLGNSLNFLANNLQFIIKSGLKWRAYAISVW